MKYLLFISFIGFSLFAFSQSNSDLQLAQHYYGQGDYLKAREYYEKIYNESPSLVIFKKYYECLVETKEYKIAEKTLKKEIAKTSNNVDLKLQLAGFYSDREQSGKANKIYDDLSKIKLILPHNAFHYLAPFW